MFEGSARATRPDGLAEHRFLLAADAAPTVEPPRTPLAPGVGRSARVPLFGFEFSVGSAAEILADAAGQPALRPRLVATANIDHVVTLADDPAFRHAYAGAAARTLDGTPLVWLARLLGHAQARRVTGHDLLACVLARPSAYGGRVFLVCANERIAAVIGDRLRAGGLGDAHIAWAVPPFGFEDDPAYGRALAERVREHGTDLLLMGVGAPKSEVWVDRQGAALGTPVVLCVGEALGVAAGLIPRAPLAVQRAGLEWAFRFLGAPGRLFRRYFVRSWRFLPIALQEAARPGVGAAGRRA